MRVAFLKRFLDREEFSQYSRLVAYIEVVFISILLIFFFLHLILQTGFLVNDYLSLIVLFGLHFLNIGTLMIRLRMNYKARAIRMLGNILSATGLIYLLLAFPFNVSHAGDFLPFIGDFITDLFSNYTILMLQVLVLYFVIFSIYDALRLYFRSQTNISNNVAVKNGIIQN